MAITAGVNSRAFTQWCGRRDSNPIPVPGQGIQSGLTCGFGSPRITRFICYRAPIVGGMWAVLLRSPRRS